MKFVDDDDDDDEIIALHFSFHFISFI